MNEKMVLLIIQNAIPLFCVLVAISIFLWSTVFAIVFLVTKTRSKKLFGAEFDPVEPHTDRRNKR